MYDINDFKAFMENSPTPFHAVLSAKNILEESGFERLDLSSRWQLERGKSYYVISNDSYICAFRIGKEAEPYDGCHIAASHSDSPCFRIKPVPELKIGGYLCLDTEVYGGARLESWHDRPLSIAGRVACRSDDPLRPECRFVDLKRPVAMIADLAPHISDKSKVEAKRSCRMYPVIGTDSGENDNFFRGFMGKELGVKPEDILDYELYVYNCMPCTDWGIDGQFIASPRLDNLTSVFACMAGIAEAGGEKGISAAIAYDHEEIGNRSKSGANSNITEYIFKRIYMSLGYDEQDYMIAMSRSLIFYLDAAHAFNPMYGERYDKNNRCVLGEGICIKQACTQSYATDSIMTGVVEQLCSKYDIPYQKFSNHSDIKGGGTIGSVISAMLPANAVDMGVPLLSMHSACEMIGSRDEIRLKDLLKSFFDER